MLCIHVLTCCAQVNCLLGGLSVHFPEDGVAFWPEDAEDWLDDLAPAGIDLPFLGTQ